jgi:hypothetical protein
MITFLVGISAVCIGLNTRDVREFEKLLRANHDVPSHARALVLRDSPRCRRIAAAAGYAERRVSVLQVDGLYAVIFADELLVLNRQLRVVPARGRTPR